MNTQPPEPPRFHAPLLSNFADEALLDAIRRAPSVIRSRLRGADLRGADLAEVNLSEADLSDADLRGANLTEALLNDADLRRANLARAQLVEAILIEGNLAEANLDGATLTGAKLTGADLSGAYLKTATLTEVHLDDVVWTTSTVWPESVAPEVFTRSEQCPDGSFVIRRGTRVPPGDERTAVTQVSADPSETRRALGPGVEAASAASAAPSGAAWSATDNAARARQPNRDRNRPGRPKSVQAQQSPVDHRHQSW